MKKTIAVILAVIIALSCSGLAFAEDSTTTTRAGYYCGYCETYFESQEALNEHMQIYHHYECPYCHNIFTDAALYNEHLPICKDNHPTQVDPADISIDNILQTLLSFFDRTNANFDTYLYTDIQNVLIQVIELMNNLINNLFAYGVIGGNNEATVQGACDELEAKVKGANLEPELFAEFEGILGSLRQAIKNLYANSAETEVEETVAEELPGTGSATAGIMIFAAVSTAAAAAYICTKKKA